MGINLGTLYDVNIHCKDFPHKLDVVEYGDTDSCVFMVFGPVMANRSNFRIPTAILCNTTIE